MIGKMTKEFINSKPGAAGLYLVSCAAGQCSERRVISGADTSYLIFAVTEGDGAAFCGGRELPAGRDELFVVAPGTEAILVPGDGGIAFCRMEFGGSDAAFYLAEADASGHVMRKRGDTDAFISAVSKLLELSGSEKRAPSQAEICSFVLAALASLKPRRQTKQRVRAAEQAERAKTFIENNYMKGITARDVASELGIDRTHFFRVFKANTGRSPEQYIMRLRIEKAKELLEAGTNTVTEIASMVGVGDVYYFSKLFKRAEGVSPTAYRKTASCMTGSPEET